MSLTTNKLSCGISTKPLNRTELCRFLMQISHGKFQLCQSSFCFRQQKVAAGHVSVMLPYLTLHSMQCDYCTCTHCDGEAEMIYNVEPLLCCDSFYLKKQKSTCSFWLANSLFGTHQQALVPAEHGVGEGRARAVVTGNKAGVQTSRASHHLTDSCKVHLNMRQCLCFLKDHTQRQV